MNSSLTDVKITASNPNSTIIEITRVPNTELKDLIIGLVEQVESLFADEPYFKGIDRIKWMCKTIKTENHRMPIPKIFKWVGFIEGALWAEGILDVDRQRDASRPLIHAIYSHLGYQAVESIGMEN